MNNSIYFKKGDIIVRPSIESDIDPIAKNMRQEDSDEIWASNNWLPQEALECGFNNGKVCLTLEYKGEPITMFGVSQNEDMKDFAVVWVLGTDAVKKIRLSFLKISELILDLLLEQFNVLLNYVDVRHKLSVDWLRWLGAEMKEPRPFGAENLPFQLFILRRESYV